MDFYIATAQVLPTLLIGLVLGLRGLGLTRGWMTYWLVAVLLMGLAATGACLWVVRHGHSTDFIDRLVQFAIVFNVAGFGALIARWFLHPDDVHSGRAFVDPRLSYKLFEQNEPAQPTPQPPPPRRGKRWLVVLFAGVVGVLLGSRRG